MDAIRKKMQSLKSETDALFATINKHEEGVKESNRFSDQCECDIRDLGKKIQTYECDYDETNDKLVKVNQIYEEKEKEFKNAEEDVGALVVSEETSKKGDILNAQRNELNLSPVEIVIVPMKLASDGERISSTRIRNAEIDSLGNVIID